MDYRSLREWIDANPFTPFRIVMTDGRSYDIRHPNMLWPGLHSAMIGFPNEDEPDVPVRHATLAMLHILRAEPLDADSTVGRS